MSAERRDHFAAALEAVRNGRVELIRLRDDKQIHDSVLHNIETELDLEELRLRRLAAIDPV